MLFFIPALAALGVQKSGEPSAKRYLERLLLPVVFINFAVYIAYSEMVREPVPALISLAVVGAVAIPNLLGLIGTAVLGITLYFVWIGIID